MIKFKELIQGILYKMDRTYMNHLCERIRWLEIGFSGHVSIVDKNVANEKGLKPLNKFERWLCKEAIANVKKDCQTHWRQTMINELGEDPEDPYGY